MSLKLKSVTENHVNVFQQIRELAFTWFSVTEDLLNTILPNFDMLSIDTKHKWDFR